MFLKKKAFLSQTFGGKIDEGHSPIESQSSRFQEIKVDSKENSKEARRAKQTALPWALAYNRPGLFILH